MNLEIKLDESFLVGKLFLPGFSVSYRSDHNSSGGEILHYVREDIPSNPLAIEREPIDFYIELTLHENKLLINCAYNPHKHFYSSAYEKIMVLGDFNVGAMDKHMKSFCENYN